MSAPTLGSNGDSFKTLFELGATFLSRLSRQLEEGNNNNSENGAVSGSFFKIVKDQSSGKQILQVPMPDQDVMNKLTEASKIFLSLFS